MVEKEETLRLRINEHLRKKASLKIERIGLARQMPNGYLTIQSIRDSLAIDCGMDNFTPQDARLIASKLDKKLDSTVYGDDLRRFIADVPSKFSDIISKISTYKDQFAKAFSGRYDAKASSSTVVSGMRSISIKEFLQMLKDLKISLTPYESAKLVYVLDEDQDGTVDYDEFMNVSF